MQGVFADDKAVEFLPSFGPVYADSDERVEFDELITGDVVLRPSTIDEMHKDSELEGIGNTHGIVPRETILNFVRGTLEYFRQYIKESGKC